MASITFPSCPAWLTTGTIIVDQANALIDAIDRVGARNIIEVGTASGFSAVVIATALAARGDDWTLDTLDYGERCYFDPTKRVGQCVDELMVDPSRISVHRSCTSLDTARVMAGRKASFAYIDASHSSPWAAIDLLGLMSSLTEDAVIALDDILLPFRDGYSHQNASRDLFRTWRGPKWTDPRAPNMGLFRIADRRQALEDIVTCLKGDWDEDVSDADLDRIGHLLDETGSDYVGKASIRTRLLRTAPQVSNGNPFTDPNQRPFAKQTSLHPNSGGDNPCVTWPGLSLADGTSIRASAIARNPDPNNPGAALILRLRGRDGTTTYEETLDLKPMIHATSRAMPVPSGPFAIEVEVCRSARDSADYAGIRLEPLLAL